MIFMRSLQRADGIACSMCRFHSRGMGDGFRNKIGADVVFGVLLTGGVLFHFFVLAVDLVRCCLLPFRSLQRVIAHPRTYSCVKVPSCLSATISKFQFQCIFSVDFSGKRISHFSPRITARIYVSPLSPEPPPLSGCHGVTHRQQLGGETPAPGLTSPLPGSSKQPRSKDRDISPGRQTRGQWHIATCKSCLFDIPQVSFPLSRLLSNRPSPFCFFSFSPRIKYSEQAVSF